MNAETVRCRQTQNANQEAVLAGGGGETENGAAVPQQCIRGNGARSVTAAEPNAVRKRCRQMLKPVRDPARRCEC